MTPETLHDLCERAAAGEAFTFRFFYGHTRRADGRLSDAVFSQFYPCRFTIEGTAYRWAEQWMMAEKARAFGDGAALARVMAATTPAEVKRAGRTVTPYDDARWSAIRFDRVVRGNLAKFEQDDALRAYLLATDPDIPVEAAPTDAIWGIGLSRDHPDAADPRAWPGQNLLGFALNRVRAILAGGEGLAETIA